MEFKKKSSKIQKKINSTVSCTSESDTRKNQNAKLFFFCAVPQLPKMKLLGGLPTWPQPGCEGGRPPPSWRGCPAQVCPGPHEVGEQLGVEVDAVPPATLQEPHRPAGDDVERLLRAGRVGPLLGWGGGLPPIGTGLTHELQLPTHVYIRAFFDDNPRGRGQRRGENLGSLKKGCQPPQGVLGPTRG